MKQADDGISVEEVCRKAGVSQQTYYRWGKKYAGLMPSSAESRTIFGLSRRPPAPRAAKDAEILQIRKIGVAPPK